LRLRRLPVGEALDAADGAMFTMLRRGLGAYAARRICKCRKRCGDLRLGLLPRAVWWFVRGGAGNQPALLTRPSSFLCSRQCGRPGWRIGIRRDVYGMEIGFAALVADCGGGFFAASCWMSARITLAPSAAAWRAQAKPMPWARRLRGLLYLEAVGHGTGSRQSTVYS